MPTPTHPESGARFQFVRLTDDGESARYAVTVFLPGTEVRDLEVTLKRGRPLADVGEELTVPEAGQTAWLKKQLSLVARTISKGDGWPRRVTRWKPAPK